MPSYFKKSSYTAWCAVHGGKAVSCLDTVRHNLSAAGAYR